MRRMSRVMAVVFSKMLHTEPEAKAWMKVYDFAYGYMESDDARYYFPQTELSEFRGCTMEMCAVTAGIWYLLEVKAEANDVTFDCTNGTGDQSSDA